MICSKGTNIKIDSILLTSMTKVLWAAFASETLVVEVYVVNTEDLTRAFLSTPEKIVFSCVLVYCIFEDAQVQKCHIWTYSTWD